LTGRVESRHSLEATPAQVGKDADRLATRLFHLTEEGLMAAQGSNGRVERIGSTLRVAGEIDLANAGSLGTSIIAEIAPGTDLVVDCSGITFIDSQGVAMMVQVHETGQRIGSAVRWTNVQPQQRKVLEITNLENVLHLDDSSLDTPRSGSASAS
jgi:anti-anti-sigma factor